METVTLILTLTVTFTFKALNRGSLFIFKKNATQILPYSREVIRLTAWGSIRLQINHKKVSNTLALGNVERLI